MNKKRIILGGGVLALLLVVGGVWFFFFKDDAPEAVSNDAANAQVDADLAAAEDSGEDSGDASFAGTINGTWVVDDDFGEFTFDTASGSFAGFRVAEELAVVGDTTAVGRSGGVTGSVTIADGQLTGAEITVDMNTIESNESRREGAIRRAVNAAEFPTATFVFTDAVDVSGLEVGGPAMSFPVEGQLTVNGVINPVTFEIEANVRDDGIAVITGNTVIVWEDFDVTPPTAVSVISIADEGTVEFQLIVSQE